MDSWLPYMDLAVALGTVLAVVTAVWQLRSNRRVACEEFARNLWLDYLKIGLENPHLGETRCALAEYPGITPADLMEGDSLPSQRYLWFVTIVLDTCENIIRYLPRKDWDPTIVEQIRYHRPALEVAWRRDLRRFYSRELNEYVERALALPVEYEERTPLPRSFDVRTEKAPPDGFRASLPPETKRRRRT